MRSLCALVLLAAAGLCAAVPPSTSAPGNLTRDETPMFVLFTHDDGVDEEARKAVTAVTKGRESANGCAVTATMFTLKDPEGWTVCSEVKKMYEAGFEIADHTRSHIKMPGMERSKVVSEIGGARDDIVDCGVPKSDIVGFRTPYLDTDQTVRQVLYEEGFLYESSVIWDYMNSSAPGVPKGQGYANRVWPWDTAYGMPANCSIPDLVGETNQICDSSEKYPGLWEVPVWRTSNETAGQLKYAMDYGFSYECNNGEGCMNDTFSVFDILKANFDEAYSGNRAPLPIFIHVYWLKADDNTEQLQKFIDYTLTKPNVYYPTIRQLLAWMQNPVPASQLTPEALGCGNKGGRPGTLAKGGSKEQQDRRHSARRMQAHA